MVPPNQIERDQFAALFRVLAMPISAPEDNVAQGIRNLPEPYLLPSPWAIWLLVALVCYHDRQDWVQKVVRHYVPHAIPPSPELLEQEQPVAFDFSAHGVWPSHIKLECGCGFGSATEGPEGETVTFGLQDNRDGIFFPDTFFRSVNAMRPQAALERFRELHQSEQAIWYGINDLEEAGLIEGIYFDERHEGLGVAPDAYRLSSIALWHTQEIERFIQRWEGEEHRLWWAATIGDWLKAHELAKSLGATEIIAVTGPRAEFQLQERLQRAERSILTGRGAEVDRSVLRDLHASHVPGGVIACNEPQFDDMQRPV